MEPKDGEWNGIGRDDGDLSLPLGFALGANAGDIRDEGSIPGSGRSPGGGLDNPLQYSHSRSRGCETALRGGAALPTHVHHQEYGNSFRRMMGTGPSWSVSQRQREVIETVAWPQTPCSPALTAVTAVCWVHSFWRRILELFQNVSRTLTGPKLHSENSRPPPLCSSPSHLLTPPPSLTPPWFVQSYSIE